MFKAQRRLRNQLSMRRIAESREAKRINDKEALLKAIDENDIKVLKNSALKINDAMAWEDEGADGIISKEDDEYQWAGVEDPTVLITTSRDPSSNLKQFSKELHHLFPNSQRMNRGNTTIETIIEKCMKEQVSDLIVIEENRGVPSSLTVSHFPHGPTIKFTLHNVVTRHQMNLETKKDNGTKGHHKMPTQYPHILFAGLNTVLGERLRTILKYLFPVPKPDSNRIVCFMECDDIIKFYHCTYTMEKPEGKGKSQPVIQSHGPDFDMTLTKIFRGIISKETISDIEYEYRPFMNSAIRRRFLSKE